MRINNNRTIYPPVSKPSKLAPKKKVAKSETPQMSADQIRAKIKAHKEKLSNPGVKKVATDQAGLKEILKKSNFNFSAKERQVFAKILANK